MYMFTYFSLFVYAHFWPISDRVIESEKLSTDLLTERTITFSSFNSLSNASYLYICFGFEKHKLKKNSLMGDGGSNLFKPVSILIATYWLTELIKATLQRIA